MATAVPTADPWRIPDELWARIALLLPPGKPHPLGCHNPRVDDPRAMDAIFFALRTGCQGLAASDKVVGIDWAWLSMDGAMIKAPLGGGGKLAAIPPTGASAAPSAVC